MVPHTFYYGWILFSIDQFCLYYYLAIMSSGRTFEKKKRPELPFSQRKTPKTFYNYPAQTGLISNPRMNPCSSFSSHNGNCCAEWALKLNFFQDTRKSFCLFIAFSILLYCNLCTNTPVATKCGYFDELYSRVF